MERFKWFDYVGALFLLFFVTKSAIVPQMIPDSSNLPTVPLMSENPVLDSGPYTSKQTSGFRVELSNPSARPLLEEGTGSSSLTGEAVGVMMDGTGMKDLYRALNSNFVMSLGNMRALDPPFSEGISQTSPSTTVPTLSW